ncbi:transcription initiation factor TFIID subunit 3-like [Anopheles maculipalpis]|uniref:transcription initiation factor TFIID subunit 3-like n=1 Tax=Anopheles maculipalpis TaxID=1496333 RepID=UPI00215934C8|nr:transcription initiation factor TFIID subunit 3-like [Anopheles maculipalpis]
MPNEIVSHTLDISVAQLCIALGWTHTHKSTLQCLSQLTENYLRKLAELAKYFAELNNRTTPNMDDLAFVFNYLQIDLKEIAEYCKNFQPELLPPACDIQCVSIPKKGNESINVRTKEQMQGSLDVDGKLKY